MRRGDADAPVEAEVADGEVDHLRPHQPEVEHVRARVRGSARDGRRHRRRRDAHVAADGDSSRLEVVDVRARDRVGPVLVELVGIEPAHVVGLEHLRVEHRGIVRRPALPAAGPRAPR